MFRPMIRHALPIALSVAVTVQARAALTTWTVQSDSSSLQIGGALWSGQAYLTEMMKSQADSTVDGPGMTASFSGTIETRQTIAPLATDGWAGNPTEIEFLSANLVALNSGSWDPLPGGLLGNAPANYGTQAIFGILGGFKLAVHDLAADLASGMTSLSGTAYGAQIANPNITLTVSSAIADYRSYGPVIDDWGSGTLIDGFAGQTAGFTANGASITYSGGQTGTATLVIPINFSVALTVVDVDNTEYLDDLGFDLTFAGQIVATAPTSTVPEANSLVLLGLAGSAVGFVGYRRRMKNS